MLVRFYPLARNKWAGLTLKNQTPFELQVSVSWFYHLLSFPYITLTVTEEDQLQNVRVIHRHSSTSHLAIRVLQIRMFNGYCIRQIKRPIYCTAVGIHGLKIQLPSWRHQYQTVITIIKDETDISDLSTWKKEVVERTQCILGQVVDLQ